MLCPVILCVNIAVHIGMYACERRMGENRTVRLGRPTFVSVPQSFLHVNVHKWSIVSRSCPMSSQGRHNDLENPRRFTECLVQPPSSPPITAAYCTTHSEAQNSTCFFLYHWTCKISVLYFPDTLSTTHRRSSEKCHSATALTCFLQPTRCW